jgi:hypothetical protein
MTVLKFIYLIQAELTREGSEILRSEVHKLTYSNSHKKELPEQWNESTVYKITRGAVRLTGVIIEGYRCCQYLLSSLSPQMDEVILYHQCRFRHNGSTNDEFLHSSDTGKKMGVQ